MFVKKINKKVLKIILFALLVTFMQEINAKLFKRNIYENKNVEISALQIKENENKFEESKKNKTKEIKDIEEKKINEKNNKFENKFKEQVKPENKNKKIYKVKKEFKSNRTKINTNTKKINKNNDVGENKRDKDIDKNKNNNEEIQFSDKIITFGGRNFEVKEKFVGKVTAYTSTGRLTATGSKPELGTLAVNKNKISFGSKIIIKCRNGKIYVGSASDTGSALINNRCLIDIFMKSKLDCINFGRQEAEVYVVL